MDKLLRKNFVYNFITQVLTVLTPFIISPYISRVFNVQLIGDYNYCYAIVSIFALFANMGISIYGVPAIAKSKESKEERSKIFLELLLIKLIFAIISIVIYFLFIAFVFEARYRIYFSLFCIYILSTLFDITWFFQAMENFKIICIRTIIIKAISLFCIFSFVNDIDDMNLYILINMISVLLPNILLFPTLKGKVFFKKYKLDIKKHLKPIFALLLPGIAYTFYAMIDKTMIKMITGNTIEVGYYEQAYKIAFIGVTIISVFATVLASRISSMKNDDEIRDLHKISYCIVTYITIPMLIGMMLLANYFIPAYYGLGYEGSINILKIFAPLPFVMGISNFVSYQYFIPKIITKPQIIVIFSSIVLNIILNFVFIKLYGGFGAALATIISETFISTCYIIVYSKFQSVSNIFKYTYKSIISGIITFCLVYFLINNIPCISIFLFIIYILIILILFFLFLFILQDVMLIKILKNLMNKFKEVKNDK